MGFHEVLRVIAENSEKAVLAFNDEMQIEFLNTSMKHILGFSEGFSPVFINELICDDSISKIKRIPKGILEKIDLRLKVKSFSEEIIGACAYSFKECKETKWIILHEKERCLDGGSKEEREMPIGEEADEEAASTYNRSHENIIADLLIPDMEGSLKALLDEINDGLAVVGEDTVIKYCNRKLADMLMLKPEEIVNREFESFLDENNVLVFKAEWEKRRIGDNKPYEIQVKKSNGQTAEVMIFPSPVFDRNGTFAGSLSVVTDITKRKMMEEALRKSEERYRMIFENSPFGIIHFDESGVLIDFNDAFVEIIGAKKELLKGFRLLDRLENEDVKKAIRDALENGEGRHEGEYVSVTTGHKSEIRLVFSRILSNEGKTIGGMGLIEDISERVNASRLIETQRDLAVKLSGAEDVSDVFRIALEGILEAVGFDAGGIYELNDASGGLDLVYSKGISKDFLKIASHYEASSPSAQFVFKGESRFVKYEELLKSIGVTVNDIRIREGFKLLALVPIIYEGEVLGCVNIASRSEVEFEASKKDIIIGLAGHVGQAITRSKMAKKMKYSDMRYRFILQNARDFIFTHDRDFRILSMNEAMEKAIGLKESAALGKSVFEIIEMEDIGKKKLRDSLNSIHEGSDFQVGEAKIRTGDGRSLIWDMTSAPVFNENGDIGAISIFARDVTEKYEMRKRLEALNRCLLNLESDQRKNIIRIIDSALEIVGASRITYTRAEPEYLVQYDTSNELDRFERFADKTEAIRLGNIKGERERPVYMEDLNNFLHNSIPPEDELGNKLAALALVRSIDGIIGRVALYLKSDHEIGSERRELFEMIIRAISIEEERLSRETSLRGFVDIASHELRHPTALLMGYAKMLEGYSENLDAKGKEEAVAAISLGAHRLNRLIDELLELSRIEKAGLVIERKIADPIDAIRKAMNDALELHEGRRVTLNASADIERIYIDDKRIRQLMLILIDNAIKFSDKNTSILIHASMEKGNLKVKVTDEGCGIPEDERQKVFNRFYQVEDVKYHSTPGLGLGLYIASKIIEAHNGIIWNEKAEGRGTVFCFEIRG